MVRSQAVCVYILHLPSDVVIAVPRLSSRHALGAHTVRGAGAGAHPTGGRRLQSARPHGRDRHLQERRPTAEGYFRHAALPRNNSAVQSDDTAGEASTVFFHVSLDDGLIFFCY